MGEAEDRCVKVERNWGSHGRTERRKHSHQLTFGVEKGRPTSVAGTERNVEVLAMCLGRL